MSNCLFEATLQKIEQVCNCTPKNFIKVTETYSSCIGDKKKCMNDILDDIGNVRSIDDNGEIKECYATCQDQKHSFMISQASYPSSNSFNRQPEFCVVVKKLINSCKGSRKLILDKIYPELCPNIQLLFDNNTQLHCEDLQKQTSGGNSTGEMWKNLSEKSNIRYAYKSLPDVELFIIITPKHLIQISFRICP